MSLAKSSGQSTRLPSSSWRLAGKSQMEIAQVVGCNQSTVSRTLAEWADSRGLARKYAEAKSLEMMKRFVKEASPPDTSSRCRRSWTWCVRTRKSRATQGS